MSLGVATHDFEVAAILSEDFRGERVVRVMQKNQGLQSSISGKSALFEPLCYPLLFSHGENGWSDDIRKNVSFQQYLQSRALMPDTFTSHDSSTNLIGHYAKVNRADGRVEEEDGDTVGYVDENDVWHPPKRPFFPSNRFSLLYRCGQTYFVDQLSRIIDSRILYQKNP